MAIEQEEKLPLKRKTCEENAHTEGKRGGSASSVPAGPSRRARASRWLKPAAATLGAILATCAISYVANLEETGADAASGLLATTKAVAEACRLQDILVALPFGILICCDSLSCRRARPRSVVLLALVLDLVVFASAAMGQTHHLASLYADRTHVILSLLFFLVLWVYLFYVLRFIFRKSASLVPRLFNVPQPSGEHGPSLPPDSDPEKRRRGMRSSRARLFLLSFAVLLVAWSPYVVSMAPGSDCPDMGSQLFQFVTGSYSTHHPLYSTFVYGALFSLGNAIAGMNTGLLFMMIFQTLALAGALAFEVAELSRMGLDRRVPVAALAFFAIVPVFGAYCQWIVKDSLFGACFALYATVYVRCCIQAREAAVPTRDLVLLLAASVAVGLLRNNGFYVVTLSALAFAVVYRKKLPAGKVVLLLAAIPLILGLNQAALLATHAQPGDLREALSIPFQQTARCALEHPDDVTQEEREAIDAVLDYSDLAERYRWCIADPVKGKAKTGDKGALLEYFRVWAAQGLRHPVCYLESFLAQSFGYWSFEDPSVPSVQNREFAKFYKPNFIEKRLGDDWPGHVPEDTTGNIFPELAEGATEAVVVFKNAPLLGLFSGCGIYVLSGLALAALAFYRGRPGALIVLAPSAFLLLTCIAGPLNGSTRYALGCIAAFPVVTCAILYLLFGPRPRKGGAPELRHARFALRLPLPRRWRRASASAGPCAPRNVHCIPRQARTGRT